MHSWNGTVSDSQRAEKREHGINRALPLYPLEVSCQCVHSSHTPLESWTTIQMEVADLHPMQFSSAHYFSGPLCCRNAPFALCAKLKPWFPAHIWPLTVSCSFGQSKEVKLSHRFGLCAQGTAWSHLLTTDTTEQHTLSTWWSWILIPVWMITKKFFTLSSISSF